MHQLLLLFIIFIFIIILLRGFDLINDLKKQIINLKIKINNFERRIYILLKDNFKSKDSFDKNINQSTLSDSITDNIYNSDKTEENSIKNENDDYLNDDDQKDINEDDINQYKDVQSDNDQIDDNSLDDNKDDDNKDVDYDIQENFLDKPFRKNNIQENFIDKPLRKTNNKRLNYMNTINPYSKSNANIYNFNLKNVINSLNRDWIEDNKINSWEDQFGSSCSQTDDYLYQMNYERLKF